MDTTHYGAYNFIDLEAVGEIKLGKRDLPAGDGVL